jgi:hypothetical protein
MRVPDVSKVLVIALAGVSLSASACEYPDEGNMPLRRAVGRVKFLPETEAWAAAMHRAGAVVQYSVLLDRERFAHGRCYWTVEARAQGETWRRFYVTPDGQRVLSETGDPLPAAGR